MKKIQLKIEVDGIFGKQKWMVRIAPKTRNGQKCKGWDLWSFENNKWIKMTRGSKRLLGETEQEAINNLLTCGEYVFDKKVIEKTVID